MVRLCTLTLMVLVMTAIPSAQLRAADGTQTNTAVFARCATNVGRLKALRMSIQHERREAAPKKGIVTMSGGGNASARFDVLMATGGRFAVRKFANSALVALVICDGTTVYEYDAESGTWTSYPETWRAKYHLGHPLLVDDPTMQLFATCWMDDNGQSYASWLEALVGSWDMKPTTVCKNNRRQWVFRVRKTRRQAIVSMDLEGTMTIDAASGLPMMMQEVITISMLLGGRVSQTTTTDAWVACDPNPPVSVDTFTWEAPSKARRIDATTLLPKKSPLIGARAPDVVLAMAGGKHVPLSQLYHDRAVILVLWATWCMPCKLELSELPQLRAEFPEDKLAIVGVNVDSTLATAEAFLRRHPQHVPIAFDPKGTLQTSFPGDSVPRTYIIRKGGIVVDVWRGWGEGRLEILRTRLRQMLE